MTKPEIDEAEAERQRDAVKAMRGAKVAMEVVLQRVAVLESSLGTAKRALIQCRTYIGPECFTRPSDSQRATLVHSFIDERVASINTTLGQ